MNTESLVTEFMTIYNVDVTESPNDTYLAQAVRVIGEAYPKISQGIVKSVAGQTVYDLTDIPDIIKIRRVFYNKSAKEYNPLTHDTTIADLESYHNQGAYEIGVMQAYLNMYEAHLYRKIIPYDANVIDYAKFELLPPPDYDGVDIPYEYEAYRSIAEIPEIFKQCLFDLFSFFERDGQYKTALKANNGNNFYFDRRGMGVSETNRKDERQLARSVEYNAIITDLRNIVSRMA